MGAVSALQVGVSLSSLQSISPEPGLIQHANTTLFSSQSLHAPKKLHTNKATLSNSNLIDPYLLIKSFKILYYQFQKHHTTLFISLDL